MGKMPETLSKNEIESIVYYLNYMETQVAKIRIAARTSFSIVKIKKLNLKTNTILLFLF
jgi:hypothetical protein